MCEADTAYTYDDAGKILFDVGRDRDGGAAPYPGATGMMQWELKSFFHIKDN